MASDDELIEGIHNWCDHWCERCPKRRRCAIGRDVQVGPGDPVTQTERLVAELRVTVDKAMEQMSRTPTAEAPAATPAEGSLTLRARRWSDACHRWLETPQGRAADVDCQQVLSWYLLKVPDMTHRASIRRQALRRDPERRHQEALGAAKVATLGLAQSVEVLSRHPGQHPLDRTAMRLMSGACALMDALVEAYPGHRGFKRPGLDD
jgi:hypothetical protein